MTGILSLAFNINFLSTLQTPYGQISLYEDTFCDNTQRQLSRSTVGARKSLLEQL